MRAAKLRREAQREAAAQVLRVWSELGKARAGVWRRADTSEEIEEVNVKVAPIA